MAAAAGNLYVRLAGANGSMMAGVASVGESGLPLADRLKLWYDSKDTITTMATRAADHADQIGIANSWTDHERVVAIASAYVIVNAGLAGEYDVSNHYKPAQCTEWVKHVPREGEEFRRYLKAALSEANLRAAATSLMVLKWNWFQTNHHTGQGEYSPFVKKYIKLAWNHLLQGTGAATSDDRIIDIMWTCGHWASTHLCLHAWGFNWAGEVPQPVPNEPVPPFVKGQEWNKVDTTGRRFIIPAGMDADQAEEMYERARYYFDPTLIEERNNKRLEGSGVLTRVYPYGHARNWVHVHIDLDTDLEIRRDSFPAGTRQVSTAVAAIKCFVRGNSSIMVFIPKIEDFITAVALLDAIEEQQRPLYHMGGHYLTGQPRKHLRTNTLLGRAGMLVKACMEGSALAKSPLFRDNGKASEAEDFDVNLLSELKSFRMNQGKTAGTNVKALLEASTTATGEARHRAILTALQMGYHGEALRTITKRCMADARVARGESGTVDDDELNKELEQVQAGVEAAQAAAQDALAPPEGGGD